jgi:hypothetical protein
MEREMWRLTKRDIWRLAERDIWRLSSTGYLAAAGLGQFRKEKEAVDTASETLKF